MADPREERPTPAYGEYAPEGWRWKPEGAEAAQAEAPDQGTVSGVPHNLGVAPQAPQPAPAPQSAPASHPAPSQHAQPERPAAPASERAQQPNAGDPPPYRADDAPAARGTQQPRFAPGPQTKPRRTGDIAFTIALLALGAFGALYSALVLFSLPPTVALVGDALEIADFAAPSWLGTFSTVSALSMFALYAVALVFSIQRMRGGKLAFWVPLSAGVLAMILTFVLTLIAMTSVPELMQAAEDPASMQKLLDYLNSTQP
ncbi:MULTISPECIES: DUF6264 family protein [unclassified Leucobacter]|uniref:DUF6264 family protein n=1 Tax=unclassified Leucobacter TaxID=2621730 RepID=UPI0030174989